MRAEGLSVRLGGRSILKEVTFEVGAGVHLVIGPNGSGKTTLLRTIAGMYTPFSGRVFVEEELSYVPAEFFDASIAVEDVLMSGRPGNFLDYVSALGLEKFYTRSFSTLSSGEKKLVLVAKALAEGTTVLMDEPLSSLDPRNYAKVLQVLLEERNKKCLLVATHDTELIGVADTVLLLKEGTVLAHSQPSKLKEEHLEGLYGVRMTKVYVHGKPYYVKLVSPENGVHEPDDTRLAE